MPLVPFVAGQDLTAAALNAAHDVVRIVYQAQDSPGVINTTYVSSTSLVLPIAASRSYYVEFELFYDTNATANIKFKLLLPPNATSRFSRWGNTTNTYQTTTSGEIAFNGVAAGTIVSAKPSAYIVNDLTAGDVTLQFAQNTTSGTTILKVGSIMRLTRLTT